MGTIGKRLEGALLVVLSALGVRAAADQFPRQPGIKILRYTFDVRLGDASNAIAVKDFIDLKIEPQGASELTLNLCQRLTKPTPPNRLDPCLKPAPRGRPEVSSAGTGMTVTGVTSGGHALAYTHANDRLRIQLPASARPGDELRIEVDYHGVPAAGLNIGVTPYGKRAFFTDNWPNRARNWLATIDHISVKAPKTIAVTAPAKYQVISNGLLTEQTDLGHGMRRTVWTERQPIPSWQYSLGVAQMAVQYFGYEGKVRLSAWVFPQDRRAGFHAIEGDTQDIFEFYSSHIGPYAYEKLAQVEAAFSGGATEPATTIFYYGGSYGTAAHEMAHQWFGDSVTESSWDDVWLSEGFATYFNLLYIEHSQGRDAFLAGVRSTRDRAMAYEAAHPADTVVHNNLKHGSNVFKNAAQIYQGGAMVLHMLRGVLGTRDFWAGIRLYYRRYCPQANRNLSWFFHEWLNRGGYMKLNGGWHYDPEARQLTITLDQTQTQGLYRMPIQIGLTLPPGGAPHPAIVTMLIDHAHNTLTVPLAAAPTAVRLDPDTWVPMMQATFRAQ
jgi:aminopeptidase N